MNKKGGGTGGNKKDSPPPPPLPIMLVRLLTLALILACAYALTDKHEDLVLTTIDIMNVS